VNFPVPQGAPHPEKDMARTRKKRQRYSETKRQSILASAQREGLTANQVRKKYGVTPVTYYSWRKKYGVAGRSSGVSIAVRNGPVGRVGRSDLGAQLRSEVQTRVRQILPGIVKSEVNQYLNTLFGSRRGRPRKV
jgi:transposase-like protein